MSLRFGTDGVRGDAGTDLTSPLVTALGRAAARVLGAGTPSLVGRDTRESGPRIEADLAAGFGAEGAAVVSLGVLPTPAVAYLASVDGAPAAMISASHNPWPDNGIKLFAPGGRKLDDDAEAAIEHEMHALLDAPVEPNVDVAIGGRDDAGDRYVEHLASVLGGRDLRGLRVVADCANGAASTVIERLAKALLPDLVTIHASPDGRNINEACGSTHPAELQARVRDGFDVGLALDGDADRVMLVDERGAVVDGDQIMVMIALDFQARGLLRNDAIAVTVMSNLGLRHALRD